MKILVVLVACVLGAVSACTNGEFQRHSECTKFKRCNHGNWVDFDCPAGTHWNEAVTTCDWPSSAGCVPGGSDPAPGTDYCASAPCVTGECTSGPTTFTCTCPQGYTGDKCQYYVGLNSCNPNPCQNGGMCTSTSSGYQCTCTSQYTGDRCEIYSAPQTGEVLCASGLPGTECLNGGACVWYRKFSCSCRTGYTGSRCEYSMTTTTTTTTTTLSPITPCSNNPCLNNGRCSVIGDTYSCECPSGYIGRTCQVYNFCWNSPCTNGNCYNLENDFYCLCPSTYTGKRCDQSTAGPCDTNPCFNDGVCEASGTSYQCRCKPNYSGSKCETFNNPCDSSPCGVGGFCTSNDVNFFCSCRTGYSGSRCENRDFCVDQTCSLRGQCVSKSTGYECNCNAGYTGENCEYRDFCATNPCINGTCYNEASTYRCVCPTGYIGNPCIECSKLWQCPLNRMPFVVPDVTDNTKYIICSNGTMTTYDCSANLKYDPLQLQCL